MNRYIGFYVLITLIFLSAIQGIRAATVSSTVITTISASSFTTRQYRWYANVDALTPTSPSAGENASITTPASGAQVRLRQNLRADVLPFPSGQTVKLQYANTTSGPWTDVSTSTVWTFFDNPSVADGQIIVAPVLSGSDVGESYGESNPSAASPNTLLGGQTGEWDWSLENQSAATTDRWFFRMIMASGTVFDTYETYPELSPASTSTPPSSGGGGGGGAYLPPPGPLPSGTTASSTGGIIVKTGEPPSPCDSPIVARIDLNGDCRIDMVDLSILVYYYDQTGPAIGRYDFSENGRVDLFDVSVMMFYWTD